MSSNAHRAKSAEGHVLRIDQDVPVRFTYPVYFVDDLFGANFREMERLFARDGDQSPRNVLFVVDDGVITHHPGLLDALTRRAMEADDLWQLAGSPLVIPGGEGAKNDATIIDLVHHRIHSAGVCRHSYVVAIGGGAVLDVVGYAAATAHRGIRLIRVPTTVLAQNDSGVGVKNGINAYGKKNFLGSFAPPYAVFNDPGFLSTLDDRDWRSGISEAVKVALVKDPEFFEFLEREAAALDARDAAAMRTLVVRCAELHLEHIRTSGDPFELGSSRPLDFGHWAAHKIEQLSDYRVRHGEAVAIGIALDCTYAYLSGLLDEEPWERVWNVLQAVGFDLYTSEMGIRETPDSHWPRLFEGLEEFREHLGGRLTILLITDIGESVEVNEVDLDRYQHALDLMRARVQSSIGA